MYNRAPLVRAKTFPKFPSYSNQGRATLQSQLRVLWHHGTNSNFARST